MIKLILAVLSIGLLSACDRPSAVVVESQSMNVYHVESRHPNNGGFQHKYEYWISDESNRGWVLVSDQKFDLGDEIKIIKVNK